MRIIGIDPGFAGGVAILTNPGGYWIATAYPMPTIVRKDGKKTRTSMDIPALRALLALPGLSAAYIEHAQPMPKQGVVSVFNFGRGFGVIEGVLGALKIPYTVVKPRDWQREVLSGVAAKGTKKASIETAKRLFPATSLRPTDKCKVDSHGIADAVMIGVHGVRVHQCAQGGTKA